MKIINIFLFICCVFFISCQPEPKYHSPIELIINNNSTELATVSTQRLDYIDPNTGEIIKGEPNPIIAGDIQAGLTNSYTRESGYYYNIMITSTSYYWELLDQWVSFDNDFEWSIYDIPPPAPTPLPSNYYAINPTHQEVYNSLIIYLADKSELPLNGTITCSGKIVDVKYTKVTHPVKLKKWGTRSVVIYNKDGKVMSAQNYGDTGEIFPRGNEYQGVYSSTIDIQIIQ